MGKVRINTIGDEAAEKEQKVKAEKRKEAKKFEKKAEEKDQVETKTQPQEEAPKEEKAAEKTAEEPKKEKKIKQKNTKARERSEKYKTAKALIDKNKFYSVKEALELVEKAHLAKFDETVELHVNTLTTGVTGNVTLPHGTGKKTRVAILAPTKDPKGTEDLLKEIESGKINFDILVATPDAMPKLAKVARILGPKGLMPNPKNGTITPKPEEVAKKYEGGQINFKTEAKAPIIHMTVGKLSFGKDKLAENITTAFTAIQSQNMKSAVVKSTMSPSVKLHIVR
ncbi:MAG: 50S ribosomal protein L1 [Candidatus Levyibacteriota bacterium]